MPKVSVIIPVYNAAKYLAECLQSVCDQSIQDLEIICINDGSTDDSLAILHALKGQDDRIIIVNQENEGVSAARNKGIQRARGQYLLFLDGDDFMNCLENATLEKISQESDLLLFNFSYVSPDGIAQATNNTSKVYLQAETEQLVSDYIMWQLKIRTGSFLIARKLISNHALQFNHGQSYGEDVEFIINALLASRKVSVCEANISNYRIHSASAIGKVNYQRFDTFFSRKRIYDLLIGGYAFPQILRIYEGYLLPEAVIDVIELFCRKGFNFFKLRNFIAHNDMTTYLDPKRFNEYTPTAQIIKIKAYNKNPYFYCFAVRYREITYLLKAYLHRILIK